MTTPPSGAPTPAGPAGPARPRSPGAPALRSIVIPKTSGASSGEKRETARRNIAYAAIGAFLFFLLIPLVGWAVGRIQLDDAVKMITTVAGVLAGIVGAIVGFYFRAQEE